MSEPRALRRWFPHPCLSAILLAFWLLLVNSLSVGSLVMAAILAVAIPALTVLFWTEAPHFQRLRPLARLAPIYLYDLLIANLTVAVRILAFWRTLRPAWIVIPLDLSNPTAIALLANMISLTPGTVSSKLTPDRLELLVHVLDTNDPEAEVHTIKQRYERPLQEIFE